MYLKANINCRCCMQEEISKEIFASSFRKNLWGGTTKTDFIFEINHFNEDIDLVNNIKSKFFMRDRIDKIHEVGGKFIFSHLANQTFVQNLFIVDSKASEIIGSGLLYFYTTGLSRMEDIEKAIRESKEMHYLHKNSKYFCLYKLMSFLDAIALGMVPSKPWDGFMKAHGGYIVVKDDGEVLCYHLYNRDVFQMYLYNNTRLEAPSSKRHDYGKLYEKDGKLFFNLNLQIRFNK